MAYDTNNIFAKIIRGEIPCEEVYSDDETLAFRDVTPAAPQHVLVIPKGKFVSFHDFVERGGAERIARFFKTVQKVANDLGLEDSGYRLITNHGKDASQSVQHFHVHILGGCALGGLVPGDVHAR